MAVLRYILLTLTVGALVAIIGMLKEGMSLEPWAGYVFLGLGVALFLNFIYLLNVTPTGEGGRFRRMFRLWLDAKERDFEERSGKRQ